MAEIIARCTRLPLALAIAAARAANNPAFALATLAGRGVDRVAFEDPGYDETGRIAAELAGLAVVRVPVDEQGLRVDELAATGAGPRPGCRSTAQVQQPRSNA